MNARLKFVDGLRGIAAMMVAVYHLAPHGATRSLTSQGYLGVEIFFVLSGFVIASVIGETEITGSYFGRFVLRRCVRLDIPYWLNIALAILLGIAIAFFGVPDHHYSDAQILAHVFYLQEILGFKEINDVYWTLCFEIQFYIGLLLILKLWRVFGFNVRSFAVHFFILATIAASLLFNATILHSPRGACFDYWWAFGLGAITWWTIAGTAPRFIFYASVILVICLPTEPHLAHRITSDLTAAALIIAAYWNKMGVWLSDAITQFLGRISYSFYLLHALVGWEAAALVRRHAGPWSAFAVGMTVSIASAWLAYLLIERPAINLSRLVRLREKAPAFEISGLTDS